MATAGNKPGFDLSQLNVDNITEDQLKSVVDQFLTQGATFKELKGFTEDELEAVYSVAYNLLRSGKLDDAEKVFRFLCFFDHLSHKFWLGLGACRKAMKNFQGAVDAFGLAGLLDLHDPRPALQAAECHIQMGNPEAAVSALNSIEKFAGDDAKFAGVKDRAKLMRAMLEKSAAQK